KLRPGLTMLGGVIGVASVVLLVAIGSGARDGHTSGGEALGPNTPVVAPGNPRRGAATVASGAVARVGARRATVNVNGTNETIPLVFDRTVSRGAFFSAADVETRRRGAGVRAD